MTLFWSATCSQDLHQTLKNFLSIPQRINNLTDKLSQQSQQHSNYREDDNDLRQFYTVKWGEFVRQGEFLRIQNFTFKCKFPCTVIQYIVIEVPMPAHRFKRVLIGPSCSKFY